MSSVVWLLIGDGRDSIHDRSLASAKDALPEPDRTVLVDDSDHRLGFAGAIAQGWRKVIETGAEWVVHLELDFTFNAPVALDQMLTVLQKNPYLVQMALKRQPVNEAEREAGGIVEMWPDEYEQRTVRGHVWTEHRLFFTTNPSVYPVALCHRGWPQVERSEEAFTNLLLPDPKMRFAFWGGKFDPPLVEHIGDRHAEGNGY